MVGVSAPLLSDGNGSKLFLNQVGSTIDIALQPITDIRSGEAHGFEALARNTQALGFASIADFFAYSERIGAKAAVDTFLAGKAARKLRSVERTADALLFLNLDRRRVTELGRTLPVLIATLAEAGLTPSDVCIEITEGGEACDGEGTLLTAVEALRHHGFRLAIDDFGTGLSGLQALYEWQPEYVKIDRFFINGLERDGRKRLFVSRVVELAHTLGTKVVAEGIERAEELHACRDAGCDLVQGFFVARPSCEIADIKPVYAPVPGNPDRRLTPRGALSLESENAVTPMRSVSDRARVESVVDYFLSHPDCSFLPVVDARDMPLGIIRERDLRGIIQSPFGRDLLKNVSCPLTIRDFLVRLPVVDAKICPARLIEQCTQSVDEGILVTKDMRYAGFVTSSALLRLASQIRLRQAQSQNPLTHLPANDAILEFIGRACADRSVDHTFCHLDFNFFKPFNDVHGFHVGDRAIIMFAELLRAEFAHDNVFLGHIGGDDFFTGSSGAVRDFEGRLVKVRARFASAAESLYAPEQRLNGYIECAGRDNVVTRFPLLSCSMALLHLPAGGAPATPAEVARELASLKAQAKKSPSGLAVAGRAEHDRASPAIMG
jgi:EAL domain-containing protein (putative c-di-GMP-specific phosphodiesterase class I)/GGDEF domain-containing protein